MSEDKKNQDSKKDTSAKEETKLEDMKTKTSNSMVINVDGEEGRVYRFSMPFHSPLPECYNAAVNVANEIARLFKEAIEKQKEAKEKEDKAKAKDTSV